ncbi:MAG: hypothetical protein PHE83_15785 [Opitutaceae bacterium]|nr:hypothetical protein [Opitutaceae bacterium]
MPSPSHWTSARVPNAASRRLFQLGLAAVVLACVYFGYSSPLKDPFQIFLGSAMLSVSALPALLWARDARPHFPAFEIFMLTGINFYAIPMLGGQAEMFGYQPQALTDAAAAVLAFQISSVTAFLVVRGRRAQHPLLVSSLLPENILHHTQVGLWLNTLYLCVTNFTTLIPYNLAPVLRAMFIGIGIICAFIQARLWGEGKLDHTAKLVCGFNLFAQLALFFSNLYLIGGLSLITLFLIAYVTASRRIPILFLVLFVPLIATLHNGKSAMRDIYWRENPQAQPTLFELPAFYEQWFALGLQPPKYAAEKKSLTVNLLDRAALFHMVCLTVDRIPAILPYLDGETYKDIPGQLVPRVIWPNKPSPALSNARLAIYLGLIDEESASSVSIAFGFIAESYANFGYLGVVVLGFVLGLSFKRLTLLGQETPQFSALGLFLILLTAWSFQVEQVMANWLTSLFQATIVIVGLPMVASRLLGWR